MLPICVLFFICSRQSVAFAPMADSVDAGGPLSKVFSAKPAPRKRVSSPPNAGAAEARGPIIQDASRPTCGSSSTTAGRAWPISKPCKTEVREELPRSIITRNDSPDISFDQIDQSLSRLRARLRLLLRAAIALLSRAFGGSRFRDQALCEDRMPRRCSKPSSPSPRYEPKIIALGTNTDPYQPIERERRITRRSSKCWRRQTTRSAS